MLDHIFGSPPRQLERNGTISLGPSELHAAPQRQQISVEGLAGRSASSALAGRHRYSEESNLEPSRAALRQAPPRLPEHDGWGISARERCAGARASLMMSAVSSPIPLDRTAIVRQSRSMSCHVALFRLRPGPAIFTASV